MNWDWDKLQEKRQRQNWGRPQQPHPDETDRQDDFIIDDANERGNGTNNNNNDNNGNFFGKNPFGEGGNPFKNVKFRKGTAPSGAPKWILLAAVALWFASGIYIVNPDEQGVVLRFGK